MKKFVILVIICLLTGCSVNYQVTIDRDLSVLEEANIKADDELYKDYYRTTKYNILDSLLKYHENNLKEKDYNYEVIESNNPYVVVSKKYNNIKEYLDNSLLFNDYFDKINYTKEGNIVKIETEGFNPNLRDNPSRFYIDNLDIMITPEFKVINSNATKIDEKTNTYHFMIKNDTIDFKILIEFDTGKGFVTNLNVKIFLILATLAVIIFWTVFFINKKKKEK